MSLLKFVQNYPGEEIGGITVELHHFQYVTGGSEEPLMVSLS